MIHDQSPQKWIKSRPLNLQLDSLLTALWGPVAGVKFIKAH